MLQLIGKAELLCNLFYLWHNPYRVVKKFLQKKGVEDVHQYGETPLETIISIGRALNLKKNDHVFELGSGRGLAAFYLKIFFGCRVTAIEQIPLFVRKAKRINNLLKLDIEFRCEDFCESDLSNATAIYLFGTCLSDEIIEKICKKIRVKQKVVSISYPLSDYDPDFHLLKMFEVEYPWGKTEAYLNEK